MKTRFTVYFVLLICFLLTAFVVSCDDDDSNEIIDYDAEFYVEDGEVYLNFALPENADVSLQIRNSNGQTNSIVNAELMAGCWGFYWNIEEQPETFVAGTCYADLTAAEFSDTKAILLKHREEIPQSAKDFADTNFNKDAYFQWEYMVATTWYEESPDFDFFTGTIEEWADLDWPTKRNYLDGGYPSKTFSSGLKQNISKNRFNKDMYDDPGGELPPDYDFYVYEGPLFWYNLPRDNNLGYYWMIGVYPQVFGQFWNDQVGDDTSTLIWEGSSNAFNEYRTMLGITDTP